MIHGTWTSAEACVAIDLARLGFSDAEIGKRLNRTVYSVRRFFRKWQPLRNRAARAQIRVAELRRAGAI